MQLSKEKPLVATIKPKGGATLGGRQYSPHAVYRVDAETARLAEESGKFKVIYDAGAEHDAKPAPASEAPEETAEPGAALATINWMTVKAAKEHIAAMTDLRLLGVIMESASKKGTRKAAAERLAALK